MIATIKSGGVMVYRDNGSLLRTIPGRAVDAAANDDYVAVLFEGGVYKIYQASGAVVRMGSNSDYSGVSVSGDNFILRRRRGPTEVRSLRTGSVVRYL